MKNRKMNFIIVSSRQQSGGAIVLHLLCKLLTEHGYNAKMYYIRGSFKKEDYSAKKIIVNQLIFIIKDFVKILFSFFQNKQDFSKRYDGYVYKAVRNTKRKFTGLYNRNRTIVVYPEMVYGNFLGAKNVVRYFLYYNRYLNDKNAYGDNDLFYCYRKVFNDIELNPNQKELHLINFDFELYKQTNFGMREGTCYILRKGKNRNDIPVTFDGPVVDNLSEFKKVEIFNKCKKCVCYDTQTFYATIAALCGCEVTVIPEPGKDRNFYIKNDDVIYGVAYGYSLEEQNFAKNTREKILDSLKLNQMQNVGAVDAFINDCNKFFRGAD